MQLTTILVLAVLLCAANSVPRKYPEKKHEIEEKENDYVYIGSSKNVYKPEDEKILRSSPYYQFLPMGFVNEKPMQVPMNNNNNHHGSLLNLNIHQLLEPFMLITFLVFVLCLLDKAKILTPISRLDLDIPQAIEYEGYANYLKRNHTADF
jgi:hypothetical protein